MANRHEGDATILKIKTRDVFCLPSDLLDNEEWKHEKSRNYSLEQFLPANAEEIASRVLGTKDQGLVLAVPIEPIRKEMDALEASGCWIAAIVPEFLLAIAALQADGRISSDCEILIQEDDATWSLGLLKHGILVRWEWLDSDEANARLASAIEAPRYVVALQPLQANHAPLETHFLQHSLADLADVETASILKDRKPPPVDFRGDRLPSRNPFRQLARGLQVALFSLALAGIIASIQLFLNTQRLEQRASVFEAQQEAMFTKIFPSSRIPTDILSRLRSEVKKVELDNSDSATLAKIHAVRPELNRLLAALPIEGQYRIDIIDIQGHQIKQCKGRAVSLDEQEQISAALREAGFQFMEPAIKPDSEKKYPFEFVSLLHQSYTEAP